VVEGEGAPLAYRYAPRTGDTDAMMIDKNRGRSS
jgi:hypothetical protein